MQSTIQLDEVDKIIDGIGYHPTFLYESIWCFCLFWFLLWFSA